MHRQVRQNNNLQTEETGSDTEKAGSKKSLPPRWHPGHSIRRAHRSPAHNSGETLAKRDYQTEVAVGYRRRFEKNQDKLFTFLDHDGIPWNNNNAEHAIKAFARLRNIIGGTSTAKGLREYLVLLSLSETCKCKGLSFLDFLLSQESNVDNFARRTRRRRGMPDEPEH